MIETVLDARRLTPSFRRPALGFLVLYTPLYYMLLFLVPASLRGPAADLLSPLGAAGALWILWKGMKSKEPGERMRWRFFFIGTCFYNVVEFLWRGTDLLAWKGHSPIASVYDLLYVFIPLCYFAGITYSLNRPSRSAALRVLFDLVIIVAVACTLEWQFLLAPHLAGAADSEKGAMMLSFLYPVMSAGGWIGSVLFYLRYREHSRRNAGELCGIGAVGVWTAVNHLYFILNIEGHYASGSWIDPLWTLGLHLLALASILPDTPQNFPVPDRPKAKRIEHRLQTLLPYLAASLLICFVFFDAKEWRPLTIGMMVTTLLVLARQVVAILSYEKLLGVVSRSHEELERLHRENLYHKEELERTIGQLNELNASREAEARTDFLTGLSNRRSINEWLHKHAAAQRKLSVVLLDIDHFKKINDTYGHDTGDVVLTEISRVLRDTAGPADLVGRFGGEEFIVLLPEAGIEQAAAFAERLRQRIAGHSFQYGPGGPERVTVSIGLTVWNGAKDDIPAMLKRADRSLYMAKRQGRNTVVSM
ncbi:hypothetical protein B2K_33380 [Paenibacillus mucilaginosus K02]|uniref:GGDEF domain-containing protein n=1 Tax=Paenibacillus mucilaginosus K02 TaxID=997761 RepID=I0BT41_9BACL|nr:hypothetical protein B2K_33380 [Paenibacillus mucilaginosus K02]